MAGLDRGGGQGDRQVGLAAAGLAEQQDRGAVGDEPQAGEVVDEFAVDGGLEVEVEVGQGPAGGEVGEPQPGGQPAVAGGGGLLGDQFGEERGVGQVGVAGAVQQGGQDLRGAVQLQVAQVVFELLIDSALVHHPSRLSSP